MNRISKGFAVFIILIMVSSSLSLFMVKPANAQTIPTPSIPEFTVKFVDHSYDVPAKVTSTFNPYNNKTMENTIPGYHVQNFTIDLTIKNQPIPSMINGNKSYLLFYILIKGHYGNDWSNPYSNAIDSYPKQSDSDYTVVSLPTASYSAGDVIDVQIKALLAYGYLHYIQVALPDQVYDYYSVTASDWSNTQTITIPASTSPSPSVPEFSLLAVLPLFFSMLSIAIILKLRKQRMPKNML
jgi:hypothetical protein